MSAPVVRTLGPGDVEAYRALRLAALGETPEAFGTDVAEEAALPVSAFLGRIVCDEPGAMFGVFVGTELAAIARFTVEAGRKKRHIGWMTGVAVHRSHRGRGLAGVLVSAVVGHARRSGVVVLRTAVVVGNDAARRVYLAAGFRSFGIEPRALCVGGRYFDEDMLSLDLDAELTT